MPHDNEWYVKFFEDFRIIFDSLSPRKSDAEAQYIIRKLKLRKNMTLLDCPCGVGRVSMPLAKRGIRVTGVDITASYLAELDQKAAKAKLPIVTQHSDMRRITFRNKFDAVGNLWTSFGYFEKESDNLLVLKRLYQALKPGGQICLHVINRDYVLCHYTPSDVQRFGKTILIDERQFNYRTSVNHGLWTFVRDGHRVTHACNLRLYSYHELVGMMEKVGFVDVDGFGSMKDEPVGRNHMMMWIFGRKPKGRTPK